MNRRDFLRRSAVAAAGALVSAEAVHDFLEWQNRRIFALGGLPRIRRRFMPRDTNEFYDALNRARGGDTIQVVGTVELRGGLMGFWKDLDGRRPEDGFVTITSRWTDPPQPHNTHEVKWYIYGNHFDRPIAGMERIVVPSQYST